MVAHIEKTGLNPRRVIAAALVTVFIFQSSINLAQTATKQTDLKGFCQGSKPQLTDVASISENADILTEDGKRLKLADLFIPRDRKDGTVSAEIIDFLIGHLKGQKITYYQTAKTDRHQRIAAHIVIKRSDGSEHWFQPLVIQSGFGTFMPQSLPKNDKYDSCNNNALQEALQKISQRFIQSISHDPASSFTVYQSDDKSLWRFKGDFVIVEGVVLRTYMSSDGLFWNFDQDWKTDFTALLSDDVQKSLKKRFNLLSNIEGKRLQLRGFMDIRNGPLMRIDHPLQVELLNK